MCMSKKARHPSAGRSTSCCPGVPRIYNCKFELHLLLVYPFCVGCMLGIYRPIFPHKYAPDVARQDDWRRLCMSKYPCPSTPYMRRIQIEINVFCATLHRIEPLLQAWLIYNPHLCVVSCLALLNSPALNGAWPHAFSSYFRAAFMADCMSVM